MPVPACFHLADRVFPRVRVHAARRLVAQGWSQSRIAQALGVSQAMVSKYATGGVAEEDALVLRLVDELVDELEGRVVGGVGNGQGGQSPSPWCATLTASHDRPGADVALQDLLAAEARLIAANPSRVVPQIGMNLARALPEATKSEQVMSFPGRLVDAGGRLVRPAPPAFGASRHLATCLLALRRADAATGALGSIRGGDRVRDAARELGSVAELAPDTLDRDQAFADAASQMGGIGTYFFHDPGAVGIEPCLYVAGRDAAEVADRILQIHERVNP